MRYCEAYGALLDPYVDGELPDREAARVRDHLTECPGCRAYVEDALAIRAAFPGIEDVEVPEGFAEGVMSAVRSLEGPREAENPGSRGGTGYWKKLLLPLAACFVIVFAVWAGPATAGGRGAADTAAPAAVNGAAPAGGDAGAAPYAALPTAGGDAADSVTADSAPAEAPSSEEFAAAAPESAAAPEVRADNSGADGSEPQPWPQAIRITPDQAGELLEGMAYTVAEDGSRLYRLSAGEFGELLSALTEQGLMPESLAKQADPEAAPEEGYLVYLTEK